MDADDSLLLGLALLVGQNSVFCIDRFPFEITAILYPHAAAVGQEDCALPVGAAGRLSQSRDILLAEGTLGGRISRKGVRCHNRIVFYFPGLSRLLEWARKISPDQLIDGRRRTSIFLEMINESIDIGFNDALDRCVRPRP